MSTGYQPTDFNTFIGSLDTVMSIVTRLAGWTVRGWNPDGGQDFSLVSHTFKLDVGPQPHSHSVGTKGYFPGVMSQENAAESSPQSSAAVMKERSFHGVERDNLTSISPHTYP